MAFYLTPPSGIISLQRLLQFAITRFTFLCKILETNGNKVHLLDVVKGETVKDSECLIEGTCKDKISHAILRLACCEDPDMSNFLLMAETLLFDFRFSCMTREELHKVFRSADRYRKQTSDRASDKPLTSPLKILSDIRNQCSGWREVVRKYLDGVGYFCTPYQNVLQLPLTSPLKILSDIRNQCSGWREVVRKYLDGVGYFCTPYQNVLQLVARREVALDRGLALVPFHRLREVVTEVFKRLLDHGLKFARSRLCLEDERIAELVKVLKVLFRRKFRGGSVQPSIPYGMLHTEVDQAAEHFPPCMAHLHRVLRKKHRLNHHARVQYTLFLKEAGLPVHEALIFWRLEYCQPVLGAASSGGCQHDWAANERRYTYSIRHLYGLEGSRINYRGHSCATLQENYHGVLHEGGCPFSHFDREHLDQLLTEEGVIGGSAEVLSHVASGRPSTACTAFHNIKLKSHHQGSLRKARASLGNCVNTCRTCPEVFKEFGKGSDNPGFRDIENIVPEKSFENASEFEQICDCQDISDNIGASTCITQNKSEEVLQDTDSNHKGLPSCCSGRALRNSKVEHSSCDQNSPHSVCSLSGILDGDSHRVSNCQSSCVKNLMFFKHEGNLTLQAQCSKDISSYGTHRHLHPRCTEPRTLQAHCSKDVSAYGTHRHLHPRCTELRTLQAQCSKDVSSYGTHRHLHPRCTEPRTLQAQCSKDVSSYGTHRHLHPHCTEPRTCSERLDDRDTVDGSKDPSSYETNTHLHPYCTEPRTCSERLDDRDTVDGSKDPSAYETHTHLHPYCIDPMSYSEHLNNGDSIGRCECKMEDGNDRNAHHQGDDTCRRQTSLESMDCDTSHTEDQRCNHVHEPSSKPVEFFVSYSKLLKKLQACQS